MREVVRFGLVGGAGVILNVSFLIILVEVLFIPENLAAAVSAILVLFGTFVATDEWVFENIRTKKRSDFAKRGLGYYIIMLTGKTINYIIYLFLLWMGVWYPVAWIVGSAVVFIGTFTLNRQMWYRI